MIAELVNSSVFFFKLGLLIFADFRFKHIMTRFECEPRGGRSLGSGSKAQNLLLVQLANFSRIELRMHYAAVRLLLASFT